MFRAADNPRHFLGYIWPINHDLIDITGRFVPAGPKIFLKKVQIVIYLPSFSQHRSSKTLDSQAIWSQTYFCNFFEKVLRGHWKIWVDAEICQNALTSNGLRIKAFWVRMLGKRGEVDDDRDFKNVGSAEISGTVEISTAPPGTPAFGFWPYGPRGGRNFYGPRNFYKIESRIFWRTFLYFIISRSDNF